MGTCIVIGLSFRFCFQLWESGFHLILSDGVISGVGRKWKRSDFFNSDFWFSLGLTTPTLTLLLVKNSLKDFSRTTFNFQGPPTRNVMLQIVRKCTFPVYLLHQLLYIFEFTCLKLIVNSCIQQQQKKRFMYITFKFFELWYIFCLGQPKTVRKTLSRPLHT